MEDDTLCPPSVAGYPSSALGGTTHRVKAAIEKLHLHAQGEVAATLSERDRTKRLIGNENESTTYHRLSA